MTLSSRDLKTFADGTQGGSMSTGADGKWKKNTTAPSPSPTPKLNAKKISRNEKKIEKLMAMMKAKK